MTKPMPIALKDLKLDKLWVIYPGKSSYPIHEMVECVPLAEMGKIREFIEGNLRRRNSFRN